LIARIDTLIHRIVLALVDYFDVLLLDVEESLILLVGDLLQEERGVSDGFDGASWANIRLILHKYVLRHKHIMFFAFGLALFESPIFGGLLIICSKRKWVRVSTVVHHHLLDV